MKRGKVYIQEIFKKLPFPSLHWVTKKYTNELLWSDMDFGNLKLGLGF